MRCVKKFVYLSPGMVILYGIIYIYIVLNNVVYCLR